jgi:hypothetical protein
VIPRISGGIFLAQRERISQTTNNVCTDYVNGLQEKEKNRKKGERVDIMSC